MLQLSMRRTSVRVCTMWGVDGDLKGTSSVDRRRRTCMRCRRTPGEGKGEGGVLGLARRATRGRSASCVASSIQAKALHSYWPRLGANIGRHSGNAVFVHVSRSCGRYRAAAGMQSKIASCNFVRRGVGSRLRAVSPHDDCGLTTTTIVVPGGHLTFPLTTLSLTVARSSCMKNFLAISTAS
jgi:hypothetical protein